MAKAKSEARLNFGYGAVYPRRKKDGTVRWYLDFWDHTGKRIQRVEPLAAIRDEAVLALKAAAFDEHQKRLGIAPVQRKFFRDFAPLYLETHAKVNKRSWKRDELMIRNWFLPAFGGDALQDITPLTVEKFRAQRLKKGITRSTSNRELAILKKMFNCAIDWGMAEKNPVCKVKFFSEKGTHRQRVLSPEEELRLLEACPSWLKAIVFTALQTGMRKGEVLKLRWEDVYLEKREVELRNTKNGKPRTILLNDPLFAMFMAIKDRNGHSPYVFPNPETKRPYVDIKISFKAACTKAGISDFRFHDCRHTCATRLLDAGVNIVTVRDLLGHFDVSVTQRYTNPGREQMEKAMALRGREATVRGEDL